jgi:hypothetical protein
LAPGGALAAVAAACQESIGTMVESAQEAMQVRTPGGVFKVRWDERGSATALGQLAFFAEYLGDTGSFERWLESCPLNYTSPNAPEFVDGLGTWMLSILDGHWRYAHVGVLCGDGVAPSILGMSTADSTTLSGFLERIEQRHGRADRIWVMDRGIPTEDSLAQMRCPRARRTWWPCADRSRWSVSTRS